MIQHMLALIALTAVLVAVPGQNVALIVAGSLRYGHRYGFITVLGTTLGIGLQLTIVIAGFALLLQRTATALGWIRWLGVAYLVFAGIRTWRESVTDLNGPQQGADKRAFLRGLVLSLVNPKTLLFNAAFLPQFVDQSAQVATQLAVLSSAFLITIAVGDSLWVAFAGMARDWIVRFGSLRNKITAGVLVGAGVGLALARRSM